VLPAGLQPGLVLVRSYQLFDELPQEFGCPLQINSGEGRKSEDEGIGAALGGLIGGLLAAHVADVGAPVVRGVGVHDFAVEAGLRDAETVAAADHGSGVDDDDDEVAGVFAAADEGKHTVVGVVSVNPFETMPVKLDFVEGGFGGVHAVEIANETLNAAMGIMLEEMPVKAVSFAPFVTLGEFLAHEKKLLARVGVLIPVQQTEIGELLPHVSGHFMEERIFSVDDFVVGKGEKEIFGEGVEEREGEFVVLVLAMNRIVGKVF